MSEADAIERTEDPVTVSRLVGDLQELGVEAGDDLLVHSSLSALGWVSGGAQAVVAALQEVVSADGTLVMPTFTGQLTDPADWEAPPVPDNWVPMIRDSRPPFRPDVTPTREMGAIAECFRTHRETTRSRHPWYSFAAWGAKAATVVDAHPLSDGLGPGSPLGRLYDLDASVLQLGTGHDTNTSFHLAEYRADLDQSRSEHRGPVLSGGERTVVSFTDLDLVADDFEALGADFEAAVGSRTGTVGAGRTRLARQRELVDFAVGWLERNRSPL